MLLIEGAPIFIFANLSYGSAAPSAHPVGDRSDDPVRHPKDDNDEQRTHKQLPDVGQKTTEQEFETLDQKGADKGSDDRCSAADRGPDDAI